MLLNNLLSLFKLKKNENFNIAVLYICTGKYYTFWQEFYNSCEKNFCINSRKHYFIFTDQQKNINTYENATVIYQKKLGWPYDTLNRFHYFCSIESLLKDFDFIFFFNANMVFVTPIVENLVLPLKQKSKLVGVIHPGFYNARAGNLPFETNPISTAYVNIQPEQKYFQGCLSGGTSENYLKMCHELKNNIDIDNKNGHIAVWHDESHLNHYFINNPPKKLNPGFAYPESLKIPFYKKIIQIDKSKLGGHEALRS